VGWTEDALDFVLLCEDWKFMGTPACHINRGS